MPLLLIAGLSLLLCHNSFSVFWKIIGTGFGSGYSPVAPGTAGAFIACGILWILQAIFPSQYSGGWGQMQWLLLLIIPFFFLGVQSANRLEAVWGSDPSRIVIDEMVGVWIAMLGVPFSITNLALAFVLFRIFDIWKPLGIRKMEDFKSGWGVMMDDVLAGIYALILLHGYLLISP